MTSQYTAPTFTCTPFKSSQSPVSSNRASLPWRTRLIGLRKPSTTERITTTSPIPYVRTSTTYSMTKTGQAHASRIFFKTALRSTLHTQKRMTRKLYKSGSPPLSFRASGKQKAIPAVSTDIQMALPHPKVENTQQDSYSSTRTPRLKREPTGLARASASMPNDTPS